MYSENQNAGSRQTGLLAAGATPDEASLSRAGLRLVAALIGAHGKHVGASGGLGVIAEMAPSWRPLLQQAPVADVRLSVQPPQHPFSLLSPS